MSFAKRSLTITQVGSAGTGTVGLGAKYARLHAIAFKNATADFVVEITDADGRFLVSDFTVDYDKDGANVAYYNLVMSGPMNLAVESAAEDGAAEAGEVDIDNVAGPICQGPLTVEVESGGGGTDPILFEFLVEI